MFHLKTNSIGNHLATVFKITSIYAFLQNFLGQTFPNLLTITDLQVTQNGVPIDDNGGLNMGIPIDEVITGVNNYGPLSKPLISIDVYHYTGLLTCDWEKEPLGNKL